MGLWGHRKRAVLSLLAAAFAAFVVAPTPAAAAGICATPARDGSGSLSGVINTYFPALASASAGSTSISVGSATGAAAPIAIGDLLLVIQMQDAGINSTNTGSYGDGVTGDPATGWTALNSAGLYEYVVATNIVPTTGGALTISSGLINGYDESAPTATQGQSDFQVIRVPQYSTATLTSSLTAAPFNGATGGVLAFDVQGALTLGGAAVSVSQQGFRGGLGRQLTGAASGGTGTDYVNLSTNNFHGEKGEGIAGTPRHTFDSGTSTAVDNLVEGYPNGSTARGAPATAGGGGTDPDPTTAPPNGNDQNTGGGGGANGGAGGKGGNSWSSDQPVGGFGGTAFTASVTRVSAGAGGGAGSRNNSGTITNASSGGSGGGIVMIRTGSVSGAGTITADGGTGPAPQNDGGGGGGAGGSIVLVAATGAMAGLTTNARGGAGANAWPTDAGGPPDYHGPGGGGGGGVVLTTSAPGTINVGGGANGTTTTDLAAYGATAGATGVHSIISANQIPGAGSGAACTPDVTIAKSHTDPFVRGSAGSYALTVSNVGGAATSGTTTVTDALPAGLTPTAASGTGWTCTVAAPNVTCTSTDAVASGASFPAITLTVTVAQSAGASLTNSATVSGGGEINASNDTATDPTTIVSRADIAVAKVASSGTVTVGSNVDFTITATNNGPSDATGVQITDALPAGVTFVSAAPSAGTYSSTTGVWNLGNLASGANATLTLTATVTTSGPITNTARKTAENETDPDTTNDSASTTITGNAPDLTLAKSHVEPFVHGSSGSYNLLVSNSGTSSTTAQVNVTDSVPAGLTPTAAAGSGWSCAIAAQTVTCSRSDVLAAGASYPAIAITVAVAQSAAANLTNTATVAGGGELNTGNDSASDPTTVTSNADIGLTKTASPSSARVGSNVTYTITATNAGPSDASGVQVTDVLPAALQFVSASPTTGTYDSTTGIWNVGPLSSGSSATLTMVATVTGTGRITNTATRSAINETDPNPRNDTSSASITGNPAAGLPGPPNGGMAAVNVMDPLRGSLLLEAALAVFLGLLFLRRRSQRIALAACLASFATLLTVIGPAGAPLPGSGNSQPHTGTSTADTQLFGKPIMTTKPELGTLAIHPAGGPIVPSRIQIPALNIDATVESVGLTRGGSMDVPTNIWDAAWLQSGVKPGATGQSVIDGHLDSTKGPALFENLHRLKAGDRIYVSDDDGNQLTFLVTALQVEPLDGFPTMRVFGPAKGRFLNLITCDGHFDSSRRTYDHRLVVFTTLA